MMILSITDIHGNRKVCRKLYETYGLNHFDIVIVNGDITDFHGMDLAEIILSIISRLGRHTYFVPGNCDHPNLLRIDKLGGALNIHNKLIEVDENRGITIFGYGGSILTPFNTWIEFDDDIIGNDLDKTRSPTILVTHNPPYKTKLDRTWMGRHVGSRAIREFILNKKPLISLHGHIHEARGVDRLGETMIINPGPLRSKFYSIIKVEGETIKDIQLLKL